MLHYVIYPDFTVLQKETSQSQQLSALHVAVDGVCSLKGVSAIIHVTSRKCMKPSLVIFFKTLKGKCNTFAELLFINMLERYKT